MNRITTDHPSDNIETALNLFYIKNGETWVRGGGVSVDDDGTILVGAAARDRSSRMPRFSTTSVKS